MGPSQRHESPLPDHNLFSVFFASTAEFIIKDKKINIGENLNDMQVLEETEKKLKVKFNHDETTIMKVMDKISQYCVIEDIHMKEAELEDILKEIYKGAHIC